MKIWLPVVRAGTGSDVYTLRLARALERHGIDAEIQWFPKYFELAPFLLRTVPVPSEVSLVLANSWNGYAFKRRGVPIVIVVHHCVFHPAYRPYKSLAQHIYHQALIKPYEHASCSCANTIVAVSKFAATSLRQMAEVKNAQIIHNWLNVEKFKPTGSLEQMNAKRPFRLLCVGKLSKGKGADLLVPIMQKLGPAFELRYTTGLRTRQSDPIPANMQPLGWLDETGVIRAYQECDALLFPSRFEGFGYVALEAMACGKPVVASNSSALPEVVENGVTGILCEPDNIDAFVEACSRLACNPALCACMGEAARKRVTRSFSEEAIVPLYIRLFNSLTNQGHANPIDRRAV